MTVAGASTVFTAQVRQSPYTVTVAAGDDQKAERHRAFAEALQARVVKSGANAPEGTGGGADTTNGASTNSGGSLALTGATATTTLIALAAALAVAGLAAFRYAPRLKSRRATRD